MTQDSSGNTRVGALLACAAIGFFALACGSQDAAPAVEPDSGYTEVAICGTSFEGLPTELFVFPAMNAKLAYYPDFASELGRESVSDCEGGRDWMRVYHAYKLEHPDFDADQPLGDLFLTPDRLVEGPPPTLDVQKVLNGGAHTLGGYPNEPVVRLSRSEGGESEACTGVFIAKNWIATAAHCLKVVTPQGQPIPQVPFPPFDFEEDGVEAADGRQGNPAARLYGYASWAIQWVSASGNFIGSDERATIFSRTNDILQYPDPRYTGFIQGEPGAVDRDFDFALLYLDKDLYDPLLPPRVDSSPDPVTREHFGAAMRISVRPPRASDQAFMEGFGGSTTPPLTGGELNPQDSRLITVNNFRATVSSLGEPVLCPGDSGGPLYRKANIGLVNAPEPAPILMAVASGNGQAVDSDCAAPNDIMIWRNVDSEIEFIEKAMQIWNGPDFICEKKQVAGGLELDYAECYGKPCGGPTGQSCGANPPEFCSRPGEDLEIVTSCSTCGAGGSCSCVVGQCLRTPPGGGTP
jgi:hypothetical protein